MKLKKVTREELDEILRKHEKWLSEDGCERADLSYCDLKDVDLSGVNLFNAYLNRANLRGANLSGADLRSANLKNANLKNAVLIRADLRCVDLSYADLRNANMQWIRMDHVNLYCACLNGADLRSASLNGANLNGADLSDSKGIPPMICPAEGSFIGYKQASLYFIDKPITYCIVELEIMEDAKRSSATGNKCRCDKAKVVSITDLDGNPIKKSSAFSLYDRCFIYTVGEIVSVNNFDDNRWKECAPGIHFFMTREEAVNYHYV